MCSLTDNQPLVSVIIPTYSRPINLIRAINSVLVQTYTNIEIIVVDDNGEGSEMQTETEQLLDSYIATKKITYLKHKYNINGSAARNSGLRYSCGEYINFLDDDDVFDKDKIQLQVNSLINTDSCIGASYCNTLIVNGDKIVPFINIKEGKIGEEMLLGNHFLCTSSILFKKAALEKLDGWDQSFYRHQDWELMLRFFRFYDIILACKKKCLLTKYSTPNVVSRNPHKMIEFKEYFLDKMKNDIDNMPYSSDVYYHQYDTLVHSFFSIGYRKDAFYCFKKAMQFKKISLRIIFKLFVRFFLSFPRGVIYKFKTL